MKRLLVIALVVFGGWTMAQVPATPQRDTIVGREVTYLYLPQWVDPYDSVIPPWFNYCELNLFCNGEFELESDLVNEYAELHVVDTPMSIIGIAALPGVCYWLEATVLDPDPTHVTEYLRLYVHVHDTMLMVREEMYDMSDTNRWMEYCDSGNVHPPKKGIYPVIERYFDIPLTVTDSFYVACTHYEGQFSQHQDGSSDHHSIYYQMLPTECPRRCAGRLQNIAGHPWVFTVNYWQTFLFPIFDTTGMGLGPQVVPCGRVENLRVGSVWDGNVLLMWDDAPEHLGWQLAVGRADDDPEGYAVLTLSSTSKVLNDLEEGTVYAARVRARCEGNENYSDWSDTIQFSLGGSRPEGIGGAVDRYSYVLPNPATDRVSVASSYALRQVEVYDLGGRKVLDKECKGVAAEFDVSGWAEGTYLVVLRTVRGSAVHKLAVAR